MNKLRLFLENFLVYGLGGIISKIIPLLMVPIVTRLMPTTEYFGLSDLSNTVVSLCSALAILGMYDAMYRLFFEKDEEQYKIEVCSTTLLFTVFLSLVVFLLMLFFKNTIAEFFFNNKDYSYIVYITAMATLMTATNGIISAPTRMQNKKKVFLVTNTIGPVISYAISIPLLLNGYYVIALPVAGLISGMILEISFVVMNRNWFRIRLFDFSVLKQLLKIAIPLFPNFLIYWIFNSCDKVMITNILGIGEAGVYSVGSKLGLASQLIYTAFAGGWQYFAFSTMKEENQVKTNSLVFEYLGIISFAATFFICAICYQFYKTIFTDEYVKGFIISPYLFLAPLLQMLFQVVANQFLVIKKTWPNMLILLVGAIVNIFVNFLLIPCFGIEGAAIATLIGYLVSDIVCSIVLCKMKLMTVSWKFLISVFIAILHFVIWRMFFTESILYGTLLAVVSSGMIAIIYRKDLKMLKNRIFKEVKEV